MPLPTGSIKQPQESSPGSTAAAAAAADDDSRPSRKRHAATKGTPTPQTDPLPSTLHAGTAPAHDAAADAALYRDMRAALADFDSQQRKLASTTGSSRPARMEPRQTAFHAALRSVLQQVLAETTPAGRHTRLLAAHAWYVGHRPRPIAADAGLAAAMAASLSVGSGSGSGTAGQQQPQQRAGSPLQDRGCCSRTHSPAAAANRRFSDSSDCSSCDPVALTGCRDDENQQQHTGTHEADVAAASQHAQRLETGARAAFVSSWTLGTGAGGGGGGGGSSGAADVPGLIPVGALPSSRFACCTPAPAAAGAALPGCRQACTTRPQQQQQQQQPSLPGGRSAWSSVVAQQEALEAQVAVSMRGFAKQRARTEEDTSRRQELAALSAATAAAGGAAAVAAAVPRALQHLDSQHQPSQVAAALSVGRSVGALCVLPDRVNAARKQHQQEGAQEVVLLQEALGLRDASALARALLPPPDVPYMSAFAQLPAYQLPAAGGGGKKVKKTKKAANKKGGGTKV